MVKWGRKIESQNLKVVKFKVFKYKTTLSELCYRKGNESIELVGLRVCVFNEVKMGRLTKNVRRLIQLQKRYIVLALR